MRMYDMTTDKTKITLHISRATFENLCHQSERLNLSMGTLADYLLSAGMAHSLYPAPSLKKRVGRHNRMSMSGTAREQHENASQSVS
jgi:hypothetical protein